MTNNLIIKKVILCLFVFLSSASLFSQNVDNMQTVIQGTKGSYAL